MLTTFNFLSYFHIKRCQSTDFTIFLYLNSFISYLSVKISSKFQKSTTVPWIYTNIL